MKRIELRKPYLYDGSGVIGTCNFCGKSDVVVPTSTLHLCPACMRKGEWGLGRTINEYGMQSRVKIVKGYGTCDICRVLAVGYLFSVDGWACFRCLWVKIAKRSDALRPDGFRLV